MGVIKPVCKFLPLKKGEDQEGVLIRDYSPSLKTIFDHRFRFL